MGGALEALGASAERGRHAFETRTCTYESFYFYIRRSYYTTLACVMTSISQ